MNPALAARGPATSLKWTAPVLAAIGALALGIALWAWPAAGRGIVEYPLPGGMAFPVALAAAPDRSGVWFTLESSNRIGRLHDGRFSFVHKEFDSIEPLGLAVDAGGAVWFTEAPRQRVMRARIDGSVTAFALGTPVSRLGRLALAADGSVWFAEPTSASVTQLKPDGQIVRHPVRTSTPEAVPFGVALAPDGSVWAALQNADALLRIAPDGSKTTIEVPIRQSGLTDVAVGPDGAVWFLAAGANKIGRYAAGRFDTFDAPSPNAGLTALAVAPDGAAWFSALRAHRIGRVRDGVVTAFALPREQARPIGIAVDADNNVWYADLAGWIGRLDAERARAR